MKRLLLVGLAVWTIACGNGNLPHKTTVISPLDSVTAPTSDPTPTPWAIPHVNPSSISELELRHFRTDFGGIQIPALIPQCPEDPTTGIRCGARGIEAGVFFTPAYRNYTSEQRALARQALLSRGYKHVPINVFEEGGRWYHDIYPIPTQPINDALHELWDAGLYPVCFVLPDGQLSADLHNLDYSLCRIVVPMWEMNGPLNNDTNRINQAIAVAHTAFPTALLYVHFTVGHAAGGSPEASWWTWAKANGVTGILYQDDRSPQAVIERVSDFLIRMNGGYHNWPTGLDVILYETTTYRAFWEGMTEGASLAYNQAILDSTYHQQVCHSESGRTYCGQLAGFSSGGK